MTARTILFSNSSRVATPPCLAPHLCLRTQREVLLVDALGGMLRVGASGASLGSSPLRHVVGLQMYSDAEVLLALSVDGTLSTLRLSSSPEQSSESSDMEISVLKTSRISPNCTLLKYCPSLELVLVTTQNKLLCYSESDMDLAELWQCELTEGVSSMELFEEERVAVLGMAGGKILLIRSIDVKHSRVGAEEVELEPDTGGGAVALAAQRRTDDGGKVLFLVAAAWSNGCFAVLNSNSLRVRWDVVFMLRTADPLMSVVSIDGHFAACAYNGYTYLLTATASDALKVSAYSFNSALLLGDDAVKLFSFYHCPCPSDPLSADSSEAQNGATSADTAAYADALVYVGFSGAVHQVRHVQRHIENLGPPL